jgi:putative lipoic acid-binding regulatory protein
VLSQVRRSARRIPPAGAAAVDVRRRGVRRIVSSMDPRERDRLKALLEATHAFPCPFFLSVITVNADDVRAALRAAIEDGLAAALPDDAWSIRTSGGGRYASHRVTVECRSADDVLALYARVRLVEGVVTVL